MPCTCTAGLGKDLYANYIHTDLHIRYIKKHKQTSYLDCLHGLQLHGAAGLRQLQAPARCQHTLGTGLTHGPCQLQQQLQR